jgi:Domain of unknown function (DUF4337)
MTNPLEHAEHISHAGHGHGGHDDHGGGHGPEHDPHASLGTFIGITMAVLGVVLAFCAAKVGAERTELIQALVEQQNAHAKYQAQDIKHRVAILNLWQTHALIPSAANMEALDADLHKIEAAAPAPAPAPAKPDAAAPKPEAPKADPAGGVTPPPSLARALGRHMAAEITPGKLDAARLADTAERYLNESNVAKAWVESYEPAIHAHVHAQERFELGQLLAEVGIVIASVALLLRQRIIWFAALGLGIASIGLVVFTLTTTGSVVHVAEEKIEETGKEYRDLRATDKALETDDLLLDEIRKWTGTKRREVPAVHGGEHNGGEHHGAEKPAAHDPETPAHHQ